MYFVSMIKRTALSPDTFTPIMPDEFYSATIMIDSESIETAKQIEFQVNPDLSEEKPFPLHYLGKTTISPDIRYPCRDDVRARGSGEIIVIYQILKKED